MKKIFALTALVLVLLLLLTACGDTSGADSAEHGQTVAYGDTSDIGDTSSEGYGESLATFSYAEESQWYQDGDAGVNPFPFQNVTASPIDDQASAVERAKNECTISYNATSEYYDSDADMWRIDFLTLEQGEQGIAVTGDRQSVYLSGDGMTQLVVYGE